MLGPPELDTVLMVGSPESKIEGQNHLPQPDGRDAFNEAQDGLVFWAASAYFEVMISFLSNKKLSSCNKLFQWIFPMQGLEDTLHMVCLYIFHYIIIILFH